MNTLIFSKKKRKKEKEIINKIYCNFQFFSINNCSIIRRFVDEGPNLDLSSIKYEIDLRSFLEENKWKYIYDKNICCLKGSRNLVKDNQCQKLLNS